MKKAFFIVFLVASGVLQAQDVVTIFNSTRVINSHSTDMLWKKELDIRISHRFGDMATAGAAHEFFGLDNSADIRLAVEYGISNNLMVGLGRCKGAGPQVELVDGFVKYAILKQTSDNKKPLSITLLGTAVTTYMLRSSDSTSAVHFGDNSFVNRLSYCSQLLIAKKFGSRFSIQLMPTYVHRNFVAFDDTNGLFSVGAAFRLRVTKVFSIIGEYFYNVGNERIVNGVKFRNPLAVGFEFDSGGHLFMLNFTNSPGIGETQFIPYTPSDFTKGEFRFGFTISRIIKL
ncbi:MAG: DUF5777 family beta-barrel protein [Flavobacteriales bacterium]